jgi:hypothetical protein
LKRGVATVGTRRSRRCQGGGSWGALGRGVPAARSGRWRRSTEQGVGGWCRDPSRQVLVASGSFGRVSPGGLRQQQVRWVSRWQLDLVGPDGPGECNPTLIVFCFPFLFPFQPCIITYFPIFIRRCVPYALLLKS